MNRERVIALADHLDAMRSEPSAHLSDEMSKLRMIEVLALKKPFTYCADLWAAKTQYGVCGGTAAHAVWLFRDYIRALGGGGLYWSGLETYGPSAYWGGHFHEQGQLALALTMTDARYLFSLPERGGARTAREAVERCHKLANRERPSTVTVTPPPQR